MAKPSRSAINALLPKQFRGNLRGRTFVQTDDGRIVPSVQRGADPSAVLKSADDLASQAQLSVDRQRRAVAGKPSPFASKRNKKAKPESPNDAVKSLDEIAEMVRVVADTAAREPDTVTANVAAALLALPPKDRAMVLRRAGRPELFEPLLRMPAQTILPGGVTAAGPTFADLMAGRRQPDNFVQNLPLVQRPSQVFRGADKLDPKNPKRVRKGSQEYKNVIREGQSPLDVETMRGDRGGSGGLTPADVQVLGLKPADAATQKSALKKLAGDQNAQAKEIGKKGMEPTLPQVVKTKSPPAPDSVVTTGTSQRASRRWSGKKRTDIDRVVANRNMSRTNELIDLMYRMTEAPDIAAGTTAAKRAARQPIPSDYLINLDVYVPWWRARFAELDADGNYTYPNRLPSAEFIAGMIQSMKKVDDPSFISRMAPLLERSIDAAPVEPSTKSAQRYNNKAYKLSPDMEEAMRAGVGSRDYPYPVYGSREIARPEVEMPVDQVPGPDTQPQADARSKVRALMDLNDPPETPPAPKKGGASDKAREAFRRFMDEDAAGTTDTSSIYRMPVQSPLRSLIA